MRSSAHERFSDLRIEIEVYSMVNGFEGAISKGDIPSVCPIMVWELAVLYGRCSDSIPALKSRTQEIVARSLLDRSRGKHKGR